MRSLPIDASRLELRYVETVPKSGPDGVQKLHYSDSRPLWDCSTQRSAWRQAIS